MAANPTTIIVTYDSTNVCSEVQGLYEATQTGPGTAKPYTNQGSSLLVTINDVEQLLYIEYNNAYYPANITSEITNNVELSSITPWELIYIDEVNFGNGYQPLHDKRISGIDTTPTSGSDNLVTSGGVYSAVSAKYEKPSGGIPASDIASGVIPSAPGTLDTTVTTAQSTSSSEALSGNVKLHKVSKTGSYSDLLDKPTIPAAQVNADWNASSGVAQILNKPSIPAAGIPSGGSSGQVLKKSSSTDYAVEWANESGAVTDVTVGGTSVVSNGVAAVPAIPTVPTISTNIATDKADNTKTAGAKAVYDEIHPVVASSQPSGGFLPNVLYVLGALSGNTTFSLASPSDANIINHYYWTFETGSTAPTITWPSGLSWIDGVSPEINASKHYEISVLNNIAVYMEV